MDDITKPLNNPAGAESELNAGLDDFLPVPPRCRLADQCRAMGIVVGDTIQSKDAAIYRNGGWHEKRLELLWIGNQQAVFLVQHRSDLQPEWSAPEEEADWSLEHRRWAKVSND